MRCPVMKMAAAFSSPAVCVVIRFLFAKNIQPVAIHRELCSVNGNSIIKIDLKKLCLLLCDGLTNVHDEKRGGQLSVMTDYLIQQKLVENWRFTITDLPQLLPQVSRTFLYFHYTCCSPEPRSHNSYSRLILLCKFA